MRLLEREPSGATIFASIVSLQQAGEAVELAAVVDRDPGVVAEAAAKFGASESVRGFESIEACLAAVGRLDAASICVPTVHHASAAEPLLAAGVDLLIEKPLAASLADADRILELAASTAGSCRRGIWSGSIRR